MKIKFNNIFKLFGVLFALLLFKGVSVSAANPVIDSSEYTGYSDIYDGGVGKHYYHIRYAKVNGLDQYSFYSAKEGESKKTTHSTLLDETLALGYSLSVVSRDSRILCCACGENINNVCTISTPLSTEPKTKPPTISEPPQMLVNPS
jgi:hypothetical protein